MSLLTTRSPWHLPNINNYLPAFLHHRAVSTSTTSWSKKLPLVHSTLPATLAAAVIHRALADFDALVESLLSNQVNGINHHTTSHAAALQRITLISLSSATGSPTMPALETAVNALPPPSQPPYTLKITDPAPNEYLDYWISCSTHSDNMHFLPQPIDISTPLSPPPSIVSRTSASYDSSRADVASDTLKFYLWISSFHRYKSSEATCALGNALRSSDGFAIMSLTDRHVVRVFGLIFRFFYLWLTTIFFFPTDVIRLLLTYPVPIVPALAVWEEFVVGLNERTFDEMMEVVDGAMGFRVGEANARRISWFDDGAFENGKRFAEREGWVFEGGKVRYRWPLGFVIYFVARRKDLRKRGCASGASGAAE